MKTFVKLILLISLLSTCAYSTTWTSQRTGTWSTLSGNAASPWHDGGAQTALNTIPQNTDTVTIANTHDVEFDVDQSGFAAGITLTIAAGGELHAKTSGTNYLKCQANLTVNGTLRAGTDVTTFYPFAAKFTIYLNGNFTINTAAAGKLYLYCAEPAIKYALLSGAEAIGQTELGLDRDITGDIWADGDTVRIDDVGISDMPESEARVIAAGGRDAAHIDVTAGLTGAKAASSFVLLCTRNITINASLTTNVYAITLNVATTGCYIGAWVDGGGTGYRGTTSGTTCTFAGVISGFTSYGIASGTSHTNSGTISGCTYGIASGTSHTNSGTISGCTYGIYLGASHTNSGTISGCNYGINSGASHTNSGTISGCNFGIYLGTSHTNSGTISGCNYGINSGASYTNSGTISGCNYGIYFGTSHTNSGTISGCNYGINSGTSHTNSGTISGCNYGISYGDNYKVYGILNNTNNLYRVYGGIAYGADFTGTEFNSYNSADYRSPSAYFQSLNHNTVANTFKAWCLGGIVTSQTDSPPIGYTMWYAHACESATYPCFRQWQYTVAPDETLIVTGKMRIPAATDMSANPPKFQIIDFFADPLVDGTQSPLATMSIPVSNGTNTDWQDMSIAWTNTGASPRIVYIRTIAYHATQQVDECVYVPDTAAQISVIYTKLPTNYIAGSATQNDLSIDFPTAEEIRNEIDANSTQLAAIVEDTNEVQTDLADGGRLDTILDAILTDTNELQTSNIPALIAAFKSAMDANFTVLRISMDANFANINVDFPTKEEIRNEIDNNSTRLAAIIADTNELQTDNIPGLISGLNNLSSADVNTALDNYDTLKQSQSDSNFAALNDLSGSDVTNVLIAYDVPTQAQMDANFANINIYVPTKEEIRAEIDINSTRLAAIIADTNELQADNIPGLISGLNNLSSADVNTALDNYDTLKQSQSDSNFAALNDLSGSDVTNVLIAYDVPTQTQMDSNFVTLTSAMDLGFASIVLDINNADIADAVADEVYEGTITLRQAVRLFLAVMTGESSGGGTATITFRDIADTKNRLKVTVDTNGNRTAVITRDGN